MSDTSSAHRRRSLVRLRTAVNYYWRDASACTYEQLVGRRLSPYGLSLPKFRRNGSRELLSWVATVHKMKFSGLIASRHELAELLGVSPATAQRAVAELSELTWLDVRPRTKAWREDGRWKHRERANALEPGALLLAALDVARQPKKRQNPRVIYSAPSLEAASSVLSRADMAAEYAALRARLSVR